VVQAEFFLSKIYNIAYYKSLLLSIIIILTLVSISIYAVMSMPYDVAVKTWNSIEHWEDSPRLALPSWVNFFVSAKLPETIVLDSRQRLGQIEKSTLYIDEMKNITFRASFEYSYEEFPSEIVLRLYVYNVVKSGVIFVYWAKPSGDVIELTRIAVDRSGSYLYYISLDRSLVERYVIRVESKLGRSPDYVMTPEIALFVKEDESMMSRSTVKALKGRYIFLISAIFFEKNAEMDFKLNIYGKVHGMFGTDDRRRDIALAIIWGTPLALSFGLTASLLITFAQMLIAAVCAWFGGVLDMAVQRLTEITMIIPFLPMLIMIAIFYKLDIWTLLLIIIALYTFSGGLKWYRSLFLSLKEAPYIEAARAYGASNARIILRYMIPRIIPTVIPTLVSSVPSFVFLEAALAILGVGGGLKVAPSWGRVLDDAVSAGALYKGYYHWIVFPSIMLVLTSIAFTLLGFTLDKVLNPRLREV